MVQWCQKLVLEELNVRLDRCLLVVRNWGLSTNERTNEPTNVHDIQQYVSNQAPTGAHFVAAAATTTYQCLLRVLDRIDQSRSSILQALELVMGRNHHKLRDQ
jgi:hypothetical protein